MSAKVPVPVVAHSWDVVTVVHHGVHGRGDDLHLRVGIGHRMDT